ncbi:unnamed protein product [Wuchereria bancrofti]|uniref:Uncharacterized protein n=2 Tax=Wuchereria bancrofti TaxID=6293 RepID=A0A3P7DQW5_WUCBA|nr:unnamed protein product [Wuchereria bancrofti]
MIPKNGTKNGTSTKNVHDSRDDICNNGEIGGIRAEPSAMKVSIITIKLFARLMAFLLFLLVLLPVTVVTDELLSARCQTMCLHQLEIASGVS